MPAGTYHYVYTVETKLVIAGDYVCALGWERRVASVERDRLLEIAAAAAAAVTSGPRMHGQQARPPTIHESTQ